MCNVIHNCKRIAEEHGWPDMIIAWSPAGNMAWMKGPKCEFNKIELHDSLKSDPNYAHAMFLHELAHFIRKKEWNEGKHEYEKIGVGYNEHDGIFADIFTKLVATNMILYG